MNDSMKLPPIGTAVCCDSRPCFAKSTHMRFGSEIHKCRILSKTYLNDGECPFCKPRQDVTNGVVYPYDYEYVNHHKKKGCEAC